MWGYKNLFMFLPSVSKKSHSFYSEVERRVDGFENIVHITGWDYKKCTRQYPFFCLLMNAINIKIERVFLVTQERERKRGKKRRPFFYDNDCHASRILKVKLKVINLCPSTSGWWYARVVMKIRKLKLWNFQSVIQKFNHFLWKILIIFVTNWKWNVKNALKIPRLSLKHILILYKFYSLTSITKGLIEVIA